MKWDKADGGLQYSSDHRYCIMRATTEPENWVAYAFSQFGTTAQKLGETKTDEEARHLCEVHEPLRRSA